LEGGAVWVVTGALNSGIFYFLTLGNNILADSLDGRFVPHTSAAHRPEIRWRVIPTIRHLGRGEPAATDHHINPLVAHKPNLSPHRAESDFRAYVAEIACQPTAA
jgi:hypothetical protein